VPLSRSPSTRSAERDCSASRPSSAGRVPGPFEQRRLIGFDSLLEPRVAALMLAERSKRIAEIVLRAGPFERGALASEFQHRRLKGFDGLLEPRDVALMLAGAYPAQCRDCSELWPSRADAFARPFQQRRLKGFDSLLERAMSLSRPPRAASVLPRLFCVMAHSSGTRSRVHSSNAA